MAYKKRNRANKYDEKLKIEGTFEEAMQALLGVHPQQQNQNLSNMEHFLSKRNFELTKETPKYPIHIPDALFYTKGYNCIHIHATVKNCNVIVYYTEYPLTKKFQLRLKNGSNDIEAKITFPENEKGYITFEIDGDENDCKAIVKCELLKISQNELTHLEKF